jgi:hypothetical protein
MSKKRTPDQPTIYQIKVEGRLDESWLDWVEDMRMTVESGDDGPPVTTLTGTLPDQAALQGILSRIGMLNLKLISVTEVEQDSQDES